LSLDLLMISRQGLLIVLISSFALLCTGTGAAYSRSFTSGCK
jgi:hypothetical protein